MNTAELIEEIDAGLAIRAVLDLKDKEKGLGGGFPSTCHTAYSVGWLDAIAAASTVLRELYDHRALERRAKV